MPVVTVTSTKGGTGKTTTTVLLACGLAERGQSIGILDFDENQPVVDWSTKPIKPPEGITVYPGINKDNILDTLDKAAHHDFVLVDGEGSSSDEASFAICASHFVLIPLQKTQLDAKEARNTIRLITIEERRIRRPIRAGFVYTRSSPLPASKVQRDVLAGLGKIEEKTGAGLVHALKVELIERTAYQSIFAYGGSLSTLPAARAGNRDAARQNADALVDSFLELIESQHGRAGA